MGRARRQKGIGPRATTIRNRIGVTLDPQVLTARDAAARRAGAIDRNGIRLGNEIGRLLAVIALTPGETPDLRAFRAMRINTEMALAALGPHLAHVFVYGQPGPGEADPTLAARPAFDVRLGSWLRERCAPSKDRYRTPEGVVDDLQMVKDLLSKGLSDPDLLRVLDCYRKITAPIKADVSKFEDGLARTVAALRTRWAGIARPKSD